MPRSPRTCIRFHPLAAQAAGLLSGETGRVHALLVLDSTSQALFDELPRIWLVDREEAAAREPLCSRTSIEPRPVVFGMIVSTPVETGGTLSRVTVQTLCVAAASVPAGPAAEAAPQPYSAEAASFADRSLSCTRASKAPVISSSGASSSLEKSSLHTAARARPVLRIRSARELQHQTPSSSTSGAQLDIQPTCRGHLKRAAHLQRRRFQMERPSSRRHAFENETVFGQGAPADSA